VLDVFILVLLREKKLLFCAIVLYLVVYHVCFQDGKLCLLVANDKLDSK
jgi:type IV secretory pathway VirB3-like protein